MGNLFNKALQTLYSTSLEESEIQEAERNLVNFLELLIEIDLQNKRDNKAEDEQ